MEFDSQCKVLPGRDPLLNEVTEQIWLRLPNLAPILQQHKYVGTH